MPKSALLRSGVPAHRFTKEFLNPIPQNVQNLDVGLELELYFRRLNVKYAIRNVNECEIRK